jgi:alpha-L-arabinofuranosidase
MVPFNPQLPAIDAAATLSQDGKTFYLAVINRSEAQDMPTTIRLMNWTPRAGTEVHAWELNGKDRDAANPYGSTANVNIREKTFTIERAPFSYRFPAHSVTVLELSGQRQAL